MDNPAAGLHRYGPRPAVFVVGGVLAVGAVAVLILGRTRPDQVVAGVVLLFIAATLFVGFRMRTRLQASTHGLTVATLSGPREVPWSQVHRVEVVSRRRLGSTSSSLEIDLDDDELLIFGRIDLGTDPEEVAGTLRALRTGRS